MEGTDPALQRAILAARVDGPTANVAPVAEGHVPVGLGQWRLVLSDSGLASRWDAIDVRLAQLTGSSGDDHRAGRLAPRLVRELVGDVEQLLADAEAVGWFIAADGSSVDAATVHRLATAALVVGRRVAAGDLGSARFVGARSEATSTAAAVRAEQSRPLDEGRSSEAVIAETYGLSREMLRSQTGLDAGGRLRALSCLSHHELDALSRRFLRHILPSNAAYAPNGIDIVLPMMGAGRPFITHVVAYHVRDLLLAADAADAGSILRAHRGRIAENWATHRSIVNLERRVERNEDSEDVALARAELFTLVSEGPARRLGWTLLRLLGAPDAEMPMLGEVQERLAASDHPTARLLAQALPSPWRNAVSHRSISYDVATGQLVSGGESIDAGVLDGRRHIALAVQYGFECGVAVAVATSRPLSRSTRTERAALGHAQIAQARVASELGAAGVMATRIQVVGSRLTLEFDEATIYDASNALAQLTGRRHEFGLSTVAFVVGSRPPFEVTTRALAAMERLRRSSPGKRLGPEHLWVAMADAFLHSGAAGPWIYRETAYHALAAVLDLLAPIVLPDAEEPPLRDAKLRGELDEILNGMLAAWAILPGRVTAELAPIGQLIRSASRSVGNDLALVEIARRITQVLPRDWIATAPWFDALRQDGRMRVTFNERAMPHRSPGREYPMRDNRGEPFFAVVKAVMPMPGELVQYELEVPADVDAASLRFVDGEGAG